MSEMGEKRIVIVGGGFAGVACALELGKRRLSGVKIQLISDKPHFEYHAALYRVVTGRTPLEVCVPLREIFEGLDVEVLRDRITSVDLEKQMLCGETQCDYHFDHLVLAIGSETAYFDTPGLKELAFGFKSIDEALRLKRHLHEVIEAGSKEEKKDEKYDESRIVVVGGGPSGTELAAELALYGKELARRHGLDPSFITVDLIQSPNRLVPQVTEEMSQRIEDRIRRLGVNVYLNRRVLKEDVEQVYLKDMEMQTKTVIWAAGVTAHGLYKQIGGLETDKGGKAIVDEYLRAEGKPNVWIAGDGAAMNDSGMAWPALKQGMTVGKNIYKSLYGQLPDAYELSSTVSAVPVGPGWAAVDFRGWKFYGTVGWWWRRGIDLWVFTKILPWKKAWAAWRYGQVLCENCEVCGRI